jgi:hypothetical protein
MRLINLDDLLQFPIRADHYDEENGSVEFISGIETVIEYAENLPIIASTSDTNGQWYVPRGMMMPPEHHGRHRCSVCDCMAMYERPGHEGLSKFCPNCGAKMENGWWSE